MKLLNISLVCLCVCLCVHTCACSLRSSGGWPGGRGGGVRLRGEWAPGQRWVFGGGELHRRVWDWEHKLRRHGVLLQQRWASRTRPKPKLHRRASSCSVQPSFPFFKRLIWDNMLCPPQCWASKSKLNSCQLCLIKFLNMFKSNLAELVSVWEFLPHHCLELRLSIFDIWSPAIHPRAVVWSEMEMAPATLALPLW